MIRITDEQAKNVAEQMLDNIDTMELMDLYDREYDDPVDALSATIKDHPFAIIEFLAELVEDYSKKYKEDLRGGRKNSYPRQEV